MSMDLTGITNKNEYYTNHYFSTVFEENASTTISAWNATAKESEEVHTPWSMLRQNARQFYAVHDRFIRSSLNLQALNSIRTMADAYLESLGYPNAKPENIAINDTLSVPIYLEMTKSNGAPLLWVLLSASKELDAGILESYVFDSNKVEEDATGTLYKGILHELVNEDLATKILFGQAEPPRFLLFVGMNQIALVDRNKWNEKRYLQFDLEEIFARNENTTLQAMSVLMHKDSLCPEDGKVLLDELDEQSQKNASGVSQDLKYALRESIELLGNEVLYDMKTRLGRDLEADPVDAGQLTIECLRYMYRMLFVLFIESRPELGYAPIKAQSYYSGYSLESLRDIADQIRDDVDEVGEGYYLHETLAKLYELIYDGYPKTEDELKKATTSDSLHDMFLIAPLKAHIFDPEYTKMLTVAKLRNSCMLRIIDLMSLTKATGKKNSRRGRISYANLGINQMGAVYEALLSYRGFIAEQDLYEVKRAGDNFNELDVGYFISESELDQYDEDERVRYEHGEKKGKLRMYEKGTFIYRLAGREREKSASYYTPEVLTKCLVKYALKELLEGKTADEILKLTVCEPAMGSAAFLNEAINQLAEAYVSHKEKETGEIISYEKRFNELQKVKMFIADRNVYGIDLNPVAVELAEVSLWLNTIYEGGFVPWFGTQLVNGNSLIGARRQVYRIENMQSTSKGMRWYEMEPQRIPLGTKRMPRKQVYHFLLGDPGMCKYSDKVIKSLEPDKIKEMVKWNKKFTEPVTDDEIITLLRLSTVIDELWEAQIRLRREVDSKTQDSLSIFGYTDDTVDSHTTIRQKDKIFKELYKSEHMRNAGPYARLKFAMDYWCALWFWPIDKADLLPTRSEFLFDMSLILEGTMAAVNITDSAKDGQLSLFPTEMEQMALDIIDTYGTDTIVDIPRLRQENPRLDLAARIAEQNKFMHWELEFADLFAERGGFDLIIGNPPWIKITWNETNVLSDSEPLFSIRNTSASDVAILREDALKTPLCRKTYFEEYETIIGEQNFLSAATNYEMLRGTKVNLYKCFLSQTQFWANSSATFAFVHPDGVFNDSNGEKLREYLYIKLKYLFQFENEMTLFTGTNDHGRMRFTVSVYRANGKKIAFDAICNLFHPVTIDRCYLGDPSAPVPGIKDENNNWELTGHPNRILHVTKHELGVLSDLYEGTQNASSARFVFLHVEPALLVFEKMVETQLRLCSFENDLATTVLWDETKNLKEGIISKQLSFPDVAKAVILSGPHINLGTPCYQTCRSQYNSSNDYDAIDYEVLASDYWPRTLFEPKCNYEKYFSKMPQTPWGTSYGAEWRMVFRRMTGTSSERTLMTTIIPPGVAHINTINGIAFRDHKLLLTMCGLLSSIVYDVFAKSTGRTDVYYETLRNLPVLPESPYLECIRNRMLLLNCITCAYAGFWSEMYDESFKLDTWSKEDVRLNNSIFSNSSSEWNATSFLRTEYQRRQALVEIDVLVALSIGISIKQLKTIYESQFPVMLKNERNTYFDQNGRVVYTTRSMGNLVYKRKEWESELMNAPAERKFTRNIMDDTMPGGPVERTIEYVAPFDRCDREQDYETAWKFFEEKYKKIE